MVPIGNHPVLWHIMKIYSYFGFHDFIISLGYRAQVIKNYFFQYEIINNDFSIEFGSRNVHYFNKHAENEWKVSLINTGLDTLKGARIKRIEKYLDSEVNMLTYGDGVADINLIKLLEFHKSHGKTLTITGVHPPARFGEIVEENNRVLSFEEKPQTSVGLINGGFMVFNKNLFEYLSDDAECDLEVGPIEELTTAGEVMVYKHPGKWECIDTERDQIYLNNLWTKKQAFWKAW